MMEIEPKDALPTRKQTSMIERVFAGNVENEPDRIGRFLARWNLQALGLLQHIVNEAIAAIDEVKI